MMKKFPIKVVADPKTRNERLKICYSCEFQRNMNRCGKCGCFLKTKTIFNTSTCPINKW